MDANALTSLAALAAAELPPGRGFRAAEVEAWRDAALRLIGDLEQLVEDLRGQLVDAHRRSGEHEALSAEAVLANLTPDQLRRAGALAAGEALVLAIEAAQSVLVRAEAQARQRQAQMRRVVSEAERVARDGRRPDYDLHRLSIELAKLRRQLDHDDPAPGNPAPGDPAPGERPKVVPGSLAETVADAAGLSVSTTPPPVGRSNRSEP